MATNPLLFAQQVRAEIGKISWPTRREVVVTTIMVFLMATLAAIFFFAVDLVIWQALQLIPAALPEPGLAPGPVQR